MRVLADRVAIEITGAHLAEAMSPKRAAWRDLPAVEFVFVRHDGWALGAHAGFAYQAFAYRHGWATVYRVTPHGHVGEVLTPDEFESRLDHYLRHAAIAATELPVIVGDQVLDAPRCQRCGWSVLDNGATVPEALVRAVVCRCGRCRWADRWHEIESEAARLSGEAQARGDVDVAAMWERRRIAALDIAGMCLARCESKGLS